MINKPNFTQLTQKVIIPDNCKNLSYKSYSKDL